MREIRYRSIADDLRERVETGEFAAGQILPSEATLSAAYSASRVTIRKALELLRQEGLVDSRQGFGWLVAADPVRQTLGNLATIEAQMQASGHEPARQVIDFGIVASPPRVRQVLGVAKVLEVRRRNLADGEPFAVVTVWCPADLATDIAVASVEKSSFYELVDVALGGASQTIGATVADAEVAGLLQVPEGSPLLECERTTYATDGEPVLLSRFLFPAHRTEFVVDLPAVGEGFMPSGLRLVE